MKRGKRVAFVFSIIFVSILLVSPGVMAPDEDVTNLNSETDDKSIGCWGCNNNNFETAEGPGPDDNCECDEYEKCKDHFTKSTVYNYDQGPVQIKTDYCSDSQTLIEYHLDCYGVDEILDNQINCNDYNYYGNWVYYCSGDNRRRHRRYHDYDCANGACFYDGYTWVDDQLVENCNNNNYYGDWVYYCTSNQVRKHRKYYDYTCGTTACTLDSISWVDDQLISSNGDGDYCFYKTLYCGGCDHGEYDCDIDGECSSNLNCMQEGSINCYPGSECGCCYDDEEWDASANKCVGRCVPGSGPCCDSQGYYRPDTYICDIAYSVDYGCPNGEGPSNPGKDVFRRTRPRYCSGSSSSCNGDLGSWSSWSLYDDCSSDEYCTDDDPTCNSCGYHTTYKCYNNDVYWYDNCNNREEKRFECGEDGYGDNYCYDNDVYRDLIARGCSGNSCFETTVGKQKVQECGAAGCSNGQCAGECAGTDTSCGSYPNCNNCNNNDGCYGNYYRNYYCKSNSEGCKYTSDYCGDCSCSCGGYNVAETTANGNCNDGKDNDCDNYTDSNDPGCITCSCTSWVNGACGAGGCSPTQRQQTRTCTPSGCDTESRCIDDPNCGGPPPPQKFIFKNSLGQNVASFDESGNLILKGTCSVKSSCSAPSNSFIFRNNLRETIAYIDPSGNLCIENGDCKGGDTCGSKNNAFVIRNSNGNIVSYIDSTGRLCLIGGLTQNGSP